ncbi:hypothetical protein ACQ33O_09830 [Ferruginibacter sp. SUN002]|uniref:hypothetical protein n=1 Tax=Ferruginibacter sp. SUN002 TaxID=2937789 RepID=UPI003D362225
MKNYFLRILTIIFIFLFSTEKSNSQVIVETFEASGWDPLQTAPGPISSVSSIAINVAATTSAISISTYSGNNSTALVTTPITTVGNISTGNWTWNYSKVSVIPNTGNSAYRKHSAYRSLAMVSSSYLITPVISSGIATISFWATGGDLKVAYQTNTTNNALSSTAFEAGSTGTAGISGNTSLSTFGATGTGAYPTQAQFTFNQTAPGRVIIWTQGSNVFIDDVVITGSAPTAQNPTAVSLATPSGCQNDRLTLTWTGPSGYSATNNTIIAFLKQGSAVTVGTPTNFMSSYTADANFGGTGTVYQHDGSAKCIYKGDGTNAAGDHSGLTITGLTAGTTYHLLIFNVIDATPTYSTGSTANLSTIKAEPSQQATSLVSGTITTSNIPVSWTAATGADGYLLQVATGTTPSEPTDTNSPSDQTNVSGGTAVVKTAATSYNSFSGFSAGTMYYFKANSYSNSGSCIDYRATGATMNAATLPNVATSPGISISGTTGTITWTAATGYNNTNHTTLVFVKATSAVTYGTPTDDPASYTANTVYNAGTQYQGDASAKCVFNGDGTSVSVTGLTTGTTYHVLILTVMVSPNSNTYYSYSAAATASALAPATYTWKGGSSGSWASSLNWDPARTTPAATDILLINTPSVIACTNVPTETIASLIISGTCAVTLTGSSSTLSFANNNGSSNDFVIGSSASLTQGTSVDITMGTNTSASIGGTLTVNSSRTFDTDASGAVTTVTGTISNAGTVTSTTASKLVLNSGGTYIHARNGGAVPKATWNTNSTLKITGLTTSESLDGLGQNFSKLIFDCPSLNATKVFVLGAFSGADDGNGVGPDTCYVADSFIVRSTGSDTLQITSSGGQRYVNIGNYYQTGGIVAVNYNTNGSGYRELIVRNNFYVDNSTQSPSKFYIINASVNVTGKLTVYGNILMTNATIAREDLGAAGSTTAELYFNGASGNQSATFDNIVGDIHFYINNTNGVTLGSNAICKNLYLNQGVFTLGANNTLTINGAVSRTSGSIAGSNSSNITIGGTAGSLYFTTGSQILKNLTLQKATSATLATPLSLTAGASFGTLRLDTSAVITTNDQLTLKSDNNGTARIDSIPVNGSGVAQATITGKVILERYLPMQTPYSGRRWRLLGVPISSTGAPTIKAAWQENATATPATTSATSSTSVYNPNPGYGTHITNGIGSTNNGLGFDAGSTANPSIYKTEPGSGVWTVPSSTNSITITDYNAYMLFVRGDRSIVVSNQYINTTGGANLRITGNMNTGHVSKSIVAGKQILSNPYASTISMKRVVYGGDTIGTKTGKTYYMWDPKLLGSKTVGSWVTFSSNGNNTFAVVPNPIDSNYMSTFTNAGTIESGNAFMINSTASGSVIFHEYDKVASSTTTGLASRPVRGSRPEIKPATLYTNLAYRDELNNPVLADGVLTMYTDDFNNEVDEQDAQKMQTFLTREKIGLLRDNNDLSIERRQTIHKNDTIFLQMYRLDYNYNYQLQFIGENFAKNLDAYLIDKFLNKTFELSTEGITRHDFSTDGTDASLDINRFKVVFKQKGGGPLPVTFNWINAIKNNNTGIVTWKVENEINIDHYEIERSTDGLHFTKLSTTISAGNLTGMYSWSDNTLSVGNNFYRIVSVGKNGAIVYSKIVSIEYLLQSNFTVYPNPPKDGRINLAISNAPKGNYTIQLTNEIGQLLHYKKLNFTGGTTVIALPRLISKGVYHVEILKPDATKELIKVLY